MKSKTIIFYDGVCFVCSSAIKTLIKMDKKNILYFSPLQSNFAKSTIDKKYLEKMDTTLLHGVYGSTVKNLTLTFGSKIFS